MQALRIIRNRLCYTASLCTLAVLFSGPSTFAQGCGQGIMSYTVTCDTAPGGVVNATRCSTFGSGGGPCYFCGLSYGTCVQKNGTQVQYTRANFAYDTSCPNCKPTATCCNGGVTCGNNYVCNINCNCQYASPIVVDTNGTGFHLTSA